MPLAPDQVPVPYPMEFDCAKCGGHYKLETVHRSIANDVFGIELEFKAMQKMHLRSCRGVKA